MHPTNSGGSLSSGSHISKHIPISGPGGTRKNAAYPTGDLPPLLSPLRAFTAPLAVSTGTKRKVVVLLTTLLSRTVLSRSVVKTINGLRHFTIVCLTLIPLLLQLHTNRLPLLVSRMEVMVTAMGMGMPVARDTATEAAVGIFDIPSYVNDRPRRTLHYHSL